MGTVDPRSATRAGCVRLAFAAARGNAGTQSAHGFVVSKLDLALIVVARFPRA